MTAGEGGNLVSSFVIKNMSSDSLAFKVKTTAPKYYVVKPNQGTIEAGAGKDVKINITL
jgi:hypothetical protein